MKDYMKDCIKSFGGVLLYVCLLFCAIYASVAKPDLYGSSASFLLMDTHGMSLSYLSNNVDDAWRKRMEDSLLANGDSHIYLYSQNEADDVGGVSPQPNWEARINHLNSRGLRPVMWLMADDSPSLAAMPLSKHKSHNAEIVRRFDSSVDGYVIGLEVDEYWTAAQTNEMILDLKKRTNKPIGVHLTPSTPLSYVTHADVLYLQTGFGLSQEQFREKVKATLSATSKPVIVSEYHLNSASLEAKALGDIACQLGAVGTGNGRNVTPCGQREATVKKKWYKKYEKEMVGAGVALATLYVVSRYNLPLTMTATEGTYKIGLKKPIGNHTVGIEYGNQRSMLLYSVRF